MPDLPGHPNFREINTPWEPQEIAWRYMAANMTDLDVEDVRALRSSLPITNQVRNPLYTHVVREVDTVLHPTEHPEMRSVQDTLDGLQLVDAQFAQLESLTSLKVAPTQWHVFKDQMDRTRTLARVQIIDGIDGASLPVLSYDRRLSDLTEEEREILAEFNRQIERYIRLTIGRRLHDINVMSQYRFGIPRTIPGNPMANQALYLVDIEPFLYTADDIAPEALPLDLRGERIT